MESKWLCEPPREPNAREQFFPYLIRHRRRSSPHLPAVTMSSVPSHRHDGKTTYCYYVADKYSTDLPVRDSKDILVTDIGSKCPVQIKVDIDTQVAKNKPIPIKYTAVIDDSNKDTAFEFPLTIAKAAPPAGSTNATDAAAAATAFDVPLANVVICDYGKCDPFTRASSAGGNFFASSNNPKNFDSKVAVFGSNELIVPKDGKYTGFAHIVVNVGGNSRADFVTYFPVQVGDVVGTAPSGITADSRTTYCWTARGASVFDESLTESDITVRTGQNCPGTMSATVSKSNVDTDEEVSVEWSLRIDTKTRDAASLIARVSDTDAVLNPRTGLYSVVPVSVLSACNKNAENAKCSSYATNGSQTFDIAEFNDQNLTSGAATFSKTYKFSDPGDYLVISRVSMQTTDGDRIDMAVYSNVNVAVPSSTSGTMFMYIGVGIGALILIAGLVYCYIRKRRSRANMKDIPFRTPMPPPTLPDRSSQYTATSSNFLTHRSPHALPSFPQNQQYAETSFYPAGSGENRPHKESFSLDPYARSSFNEIGEDESIDMTIRPSDASKLSFATGYDDDSEWEYDTRSFRSEGQYSDMTEAQRHTFNLQSGANMDVGSMPIMEEESQVPRSTTSSGWTIKTS
ncbi:hypothetical protein Poli38472_008876 [Pythium oligandrum]|uniref:Uncharacterized protein n=1 Tax=Pythium oligandrum TaxID=41045 RepID=A0A8K1C4L2_PYTOL|nr:hypothetical protein Poli38472_008876 [Pythium oligandrum]|eukprot:TMW56228.1 hypothetical protein Poli38472_008876 [Pythium oligandrum]